MNNPDQDTVLRAVEDARRILGEYIEPGPRDSTKTVERLLAVLDRNDLVHALDRINRRMVLRLVEGSLVKNKAPPPRDAPKVSRDLPPPRDGPKRKP